MAAPIESESEIVSRLRALGAKLRFRKSGRAHTVDLSDRNGIDDELIAALAPLSRLAVLNVASCDIGDTAVRSLPPFARLESLDLQNTRVSDDSLPALVSMPQLKILVLTATQVSLDGLKGLRKSMLNTRIISL